MDTVYHVEETCTTDKPPRQRLSGFDKIKAEIPLEDYAARFTELEKLGKDLKGRCPMPDHPDEDPSFYVYFVPEARAHCFSCGMHASSVIDLCMELEGYTEPFQALAHLSAEYGVDTTDHRFTAKTRRQRRARDAIKEAKVARVERRIYRWILAPPIRANFTDPEERTAELAEAWSEAKTAALLLVNDIEEAK